MAAIAVHATACQSRSTERSTPRLVVLYATCSVNKDYLSPYNDAVSFTPNIDRFAREGVVFKRHQTEAGQSGIAYASIFTGTHADRHGIFNHPSRLRDDALVISEAFRADGYDTYYWGRHPMATPDLNYGQGVKAANSFGRASARFEIAQGDSTFAEVLQKLRADKDYRAFVMMSFSVTHSPYLSHHRQAGERELEGFMDGFPAEAEGLRLEDVLSDYSVYMSERLELQWNFPETAARLKLDTDRIEEIAASLDLTYKSRVHLLDRLFGRLLDKIRAAGLEEESLTVFTADHGEALYRANALYKWGHGLQLAPEVLNVPMIVRLPGVEPRAGSYEGVTRSIDVFPTVAALANVVVPPGSVDGEDLSAVVRGTDTEPRLLAFSHTTVPRGHRTKASPLQWTLRRIFFPNSEVEHVWVQVRDHDMVFKYRKLNEKSWGDEAFDMSRDRTQASNIFDPTNDRHAAMSAKLREYKARLEERYELLGREGNLPEDAAVERLRALGYVR